MVRRIYKIVIGYEGGHSEKVWQFIMPLTSIYNKNLCFNEKTVFLTTGLLGQWQPYSFDNSKWLEHDYGYTQLYKQLKIVNPPLE
jgi:hypothetical protein